MNIIALDFETFFSNDYTLKKLTTEEYVRDERFEVLGCGIWWDERLVCGPDIPETGGCWCGGFEDVWEVFENIDWSNTAVLCHHAHFDGLILSHIYDIKPKLWLDTLSMGRLVLGNHLSQSLDSLARHYGLTPKSVPYDAFRGKHWGGLDTQTQRLLADGCLHDLELTIDIFKRLRASVPTEEYAIIDMTIRMFTEPEFEGDGPLFESLRDEETKRKQEMLDELGLTAKQLGSNTVFTELLNAEGIEVEYKDGKNGPIPAFAKTDAFMQGLVNHADDQISALASARLANKSSIDETRAGRFAGLAQRGAMPVYLGYCGAHTTRWSGGDKTNFQNMRRGSPLRRGLAAPKGKQVIVADASQIECRILNAIAGQEDVIERFRNGDDPYVGIASRFYGRTISKADKAERGTGKQLELSCGYGAGGPTIVVTARRGTYGPPVHLTDADGMRARDLYRDTHPFVVRLWKYGTQMLDMLHGSGRRYNHPWGLPLSIEPGKIILPNGMAMIYVLRYDGEERQWQRKTRNGWMKIYGAALIENIVQALARVVLSQTFIRIREQTGLWPKLTVHDEGAWLVPDEDVEYVKGVIKTEFCRAPDWLPNIPLNCEIDIGERYEK